MIPTGIKRSAHGTSAGSFLNWLKIQVQESNETGEYPEPFCRTPEPANGPVKVPSTALVKDLGKCDH
jgi:hypothetical protein